MCRLQFWGKQFARKQLSGKQNKIKNLIVKIDAAKCERENVTSRTEWGRSQHTHTPWTLTTSGTFHRHATRLDYRGRWRFIHGISNTISVCFGDSGTPTHTHNFECNRPRHSLSTKFFPNLIYFKMQKKFTAESEPRTCDSFEVSKQTNLWIEKIYSGRSNKLMIDILRSLGLILLSNFGHFVNSIVSGDY